MDNSTVFIETTDRYSESVLSSRAVRASKPQTNKYAEVIQNPTALDDKHSKYQRKEEVNMTDITDGPEEENEENDHEQATTKETTRQDDDPKKNEWPGNKEKVTHERNKSNGD